MITAPVLFKARSIREIIDTLAEKHGGKTYLIDPLSGTEVTFADLRKHTRAVAIAIAAQGVQPGDAVAYAADNNPQTAMTILGIFYGGYLATAVNLVAGASVIAYVLEHSESRLLLANAAGREAVGECLKDRPDLRVLDIESDLFGTADDDGSFTVPTEPTGGLLMYTSGTTDRPKGVLLSQESLMAGGANTVIAHMLNGNDRGMCVLPLYHINGLCVTVMGALVSASSLVMPPKFSTRAFWQTMLDTHCTWFSVVPTHISYLLHDEHAPRRGELSAIRFGRSASAPLSPEVQSAFEAKFGVPIIETMGLTETAAQILSNPLPPGKRKIGSPGIAFGNEVRIADTALNDVSANAEGEVLVRGRNVMQGYLKNEEATAQTITPDGWLRTGDLGRMDEDGYVYITGRLKELIIKGGENIAPREIDDALYAHPSVIEAAAFGRPCERYGEKVEAAVMVDTASSVNERELIALCEKTVGAFKTPTCIHFMEELPKGPSGKIQRKRLVELFAAQSF